MIIGLFLPDPLPGRTCVTHMRPLVRAHAAPNTRAGSQKRTCDHSCVFNGYMGGGKVLPSARPPTHPMSDRGKAKRWCFTLNNPQEDEHLDEDVFDYAIIGEETGSEGTRHFQGFVIFKKEQRISSLKKLLQRAHWERCNGTVEQNIAYCKKGDQSHKEWVALGVKGPNYGKDANFVEIGEIPSVQKRNAKKKNFGDALAAPTVREGMDIVKEREPDSYLLHGEAIERNLKRAKVPSFEKKYQLDTFNHPPLIFDKKRSTLVYGPTNCGKTSFVLAHFNNPLVCSHIDKLKVLSTDNDGIVFDDMSFTHWPKEAIIHLLDCELDREINVRYGTVSIPANITKVFTHNISNPFYNDEIDEAQKEAIERRLTRVHILNKLY